MDSIFRTSRLSSTPLVRFRRIVLQRWLPPFLQVAAAMLSALLLVTAAYRLSWLERLELQAYDLLLQSRPALENPAAGVDIVGIDEEDVAQFDYPLRDAQLAELLQRLLTRQPSAIGLDLYRDLAVPRTKDNTPSPELQQILLEHEEIVAIFFPSNAERSEPGIPAPRVLDELEQGERVRRIAPNDFPSERAVVRRAFLSRGVRRQPGDPLVGYPSLGTALGILQLPNEARARHLPPAGDAAVQLGDEESHIAGATFHPLHRGDGGYLQAGEGGFQFLLDFRRRGQFRERSLRQVMAGDLPEDFGQERVVLIGAVAPSLKDRVTTPFDPFCPGVKLHAEVVDQILRAAFEGDQPTRPLAARWHLPWTLLWTLLGGGSAWLLFRWPRVAGLGVAAGVLFLCLLGSLAFRAGWWVPIVEPALAYTGAAGFSLMVVVARQNRQERDLEKLFKQQVGSPVFEAIKEERETFLEGGRPRPLKLTSTVLFSDFAGFAGVAEQLPPTELIAWLNEGMGGLARTVDRHGGLVKQYVGDSIMAVFGAPVPRRKEEVPADAAQAVRCALAMSAELERLNHAWERTGRPQVGMRIGIFTGEVVTGGVGSDARMDFVIVGNTVNTASRLEGLDKEGVLPPAGLRCRILIGEATWLLVRELFVVEPAGAYPLKGQQEKVSVYRVLGEIPAAAPRLPGPLP